MSISDDFWLELGSLELTNPSGELRGFLLGSGEIDREGNAFISFKRTEAVRRAIHVLDALGVDYSMEFQKNRSAGSHQSYIIQAKHALNVLESKNLMVSRLNWDVIRGIMLSTGYISDLNPWYHATMDVEVLEDAKRVKRWLEERIGKSYLIARENTNTIHVRSFSALFKLVDGLGAVKTAEAIYAQHYMRMKKVSAQRLANCDNANLKRQIAKAEYYKELLEKGDISKLDSLELSVLNLRVEEPELSYNELAQRLGLTKTKVARLLKSVEGKLTHDQ